MTKTRTATIIFFIALFVTSYASNNSFQIDSLLKKLDIVSVTEKPLLLNTIAETYFKHGHTEESDLYASDAIIASKKVGDIRSEARANMIRSSCMLRMLRYNESIDLAQNSIELYLKINSISEAAEVFNHIGNIYKQRLDFKKASENYNKAIKMYEVIGDSNGIASTYNLLGSLYLRQSQYDEALKNYKLALQMRINSKDSLGIAASFANIALVHRDKGDFSKAIEMLNSALTLYEKLKNNAEIANIYNLIGSIYFRKNDFSKAIEYYSKSLAIRRALHNKVEIAATLQNIGNTYKEMNDFKNSFNTLEEALKLRREVGDVKLIALSLNALGSAYWKAKKYSESLGYYLEALKISLESNEPAEIAHAYSNIGNIYSELNNPEKALKHFSEALYYSSNIDDRIRMATLYHSIGNAYQKLAKHKEALENYNKSLELREKLADKTQIAVTLNSIASVYTDMGKFQDAIKFYQQALSLRKAIGDKVGTSTVLNAIGNLYLSINQKDQALNFFQQALQTAQQAGYLFNVALCQRKIAEIYIEKNQLSQALPLLQSSIEIGKKITNYELLRRGYYALYTLYNKQMMYKEALNNYVLYNQYNDSIQVSMTNKQLLDLQINFELANQQSQIRRQETEIALLRKEKQFNELQALKNRLIIVVLLITVLLVLSLVILYYNRYKMKRKTALVLQEKLDIIERINKQLSDSEEELRILNNTKDKFFSIMAHDIKNPLGGMLTITDIVKNDFAKLSDEEKMEIFENINKTAQHLYALLENILHWSRSQTGRIQFNPTYLNVNEIFENTIELLKTNIESKNLMVINDIAQNQSVFADKEMTSLIVRNLLSNAIKFSKDHGKIIISATEKNNMLEISIHDEGIGMTKDIQTKLFRIDTQVITPGTHNEKGTGLGLILCKEFVAKHEGKIWIESEEGKGSKVYFTLPLKK